MKLEFKNFKAKVDGKKLNVEFKHEFKPLENEDVVVVCDYLKNGELPLLMNEDGNIDMAKIFVSKVREIKGLTLQLGDAEVPATPQILVDIPFSSDDVSALVARIITVTVAHILDGAKLNENEVKN